MKTFSKSRGRYLRKVSDKLEKDGAPLRVREVPIAVACASASFGRFVAPAFSQLCFGVVLAVVSLAFAFLATGRPALGFAFSVLSALLGGILIAYGGWIVWAGTLLRADEAVVEIARLRSEEQQMLHQLTVRQRRRYARASEASNRTWSST